jgi:hypothetical protein
MQGLARMTYQAQMCVPEGTNIKLLEAGRESTSTSSGRAEMREAVLQLARPEPGSFRRRRTGGLEDEWGG